MKRVTLARSTYSSVGLHTIVTTVRLPRSPSWVPCLRRGEDYRTAHRAADPATEGSEAAVPRREGVRRHLRRPVAPPGGRFRLRLLVLHVGQWSAAGSCVS